MLPLSLEKGQHDLMLGLHPTTHTEEVWWYSQNGSQWKCGDIHKMAHRGSVVIFTKWLSEEVWWYSQNGSQRKCGDIHKMARRGSVVIFTKYTSIKVWNRNAVHGKDQTTTAIADSVRTSETSVDNHFTRQYNPEDSSEQQTLVQII
jgi:hypothetical protein